ncbi:hypothetical protein [Sandarakinorhabdus cyanobacteriorum]|uniref:hypothetical protein n=1 Tax=Sandarakinorhabdus cyanobacteriorum TaxID=1981098 RepID=UPI001FAFDD02|nr:hypothetical protein [Sandarakinorhabdus cyanobacteriorum]
MRINSSTSLSALAVALWAGPALAQTAPAPAPAATAVVEAKESEMIIVTGSNIRGATDSGAIAVTVLDADQLAAFGVTALAKSLKILPRPARPKSMARPMAPMMRAAMSPPSTCAGWAPATRWCC